MFHLYCIDEKQVITNYEANRGIPMIKGLMFVLVSLLTIGYAWLVQLGLGFLSVLYDPASLGGVALLTVLFTSLSSIMFWQIAAFGSLLICTYWACSRNKSMKNTESVFLPALVHVTWIVTSFMWIAAAAFDPFLEVGYVLGG